MTFYSPPPTPRRRKVQVKTELQIFFLDFNCMEKWFFDGRFSITTNLNFLAALVGGVTFLMTVLLCGYRSRLNKVKKNEGSQSYQLFSRSINIFILFF